MVNNWSLVPLDKLVSIHDSKRKPITKNKRVNGIYPYYGASGIADFVDHYAFEGLYVLLAEDGDNLRTKNTPIAFTANGKFCVNNHAHVLRGKTDLDTKYICYALQYAEIDSFISGSTRPKITQGDLKKIPISAPPLDVREEIAEFISIFDDKIELNKQTNQTLEQMAQALFKSWFVDFDPVFDNAFDAGLSVDDFPDVLQDRAMIRQQHRSNAMQKGAEIALQQPTLPSAAVLQPQHPQTTQTESERIRGLFPSEFEKCDDPSIGINGWIPKGWEKDSLKSFGKAVTGKTPPSKVQNAFDSAGIPFITPTDVDSDVYALNVGRYLTEEGVNVVKNNIIDEGSVCVTCIGSQMGKTVISSTKAVTNQQLNSIVLSDEFSRNYIFMNLRMRREELFNLGSSGSTMPILNKSSFENLTVLRPSDDVIKTFSKYTENYLEKILVNSKQNKQLENIRDSLLPKLISGEINIPNKDVA
jgi:type I restriction enzyme S subunit